MVEQRPHYSTPEFAQLGATDGNSLLSKSVDQTYEETLLDFETSRDSFLKRERTINAINANDDSAYLSKKSHSPVFSRPKNNSMAAKGLSSKCRRDISQSQKRAGESLMGRPHSESIDLSAKTTESTNSSAQQTGGTRMKRRNTMVLHRSREFNPIKVIMAQPAQQIPFCELLQKGSSDHCKDRLLMKQIKKVFADGISLPDPIQEMKKRRDAYCFTLGITPEFVEQHQKQAYQGLLKVSRERQENHSKRMEEYRTHHGPRARLPLDDCCEKQTDMCRFIRQIKKDVPRTNSDNFNLPEFSETPQSAKNPIYNILAAYAEIDQELGYTQGMNFLAATIYTAVQHEVIAFSVFQCIMESKQQAKERLALVDPSIRTPKPLVKAQEWRFLYTDRMRKLNAFVEDVKEWLVDTKRMLFIHFESRKITLEACLSNPFLSLFSNVIPSKHVLKVLDRFIHFGQKALVQMVKNILRTQQDKLLHIGDQFELQKFLARQIYIEAITEGNFFPEMAEQNAIDVSASTGLAAASLTPRNQQRKMQFTRTTANGSRQVFMLNAPSVEEAAKETNSQNL